MADRENRATVVPVAAEVVAAYLRRNQLSAWELPDLIRKVHMTLKGLDNDVANQLTPEPMVPIKKSVRANYLICLDCGRKLRTLKRHVRAAHRLSLDEYRARWGLLRTYPATAPNYSVQRSSLAKQHGLGKPRPIRNSKKNARAR